MNTQERVNDRLGLEMDSGLEAGTAIRIPIEDLPYFHRSKEVASGVDRLAEERLYETRIVKLACAWCAQQNIPVAVRGSQLDMVMLAAHSIPTDLALTKEHANRDFAYISVRKTDTSSIYAGEPPLAGTLDLKVLADPSLLGRLHLLLRTKLRAPRPTIPFLPVKAEDDQLFANHWYQPKRRYEPEVTSHLEGKALPGLTIALWEGLVYKPYEESIRLNEKTMRKVLPRVTHPTFPFRHRDCLRGATYVTVDHQSTRDSDIRTPDRTSNIDGAYGWIHVRGAIDFHSPDFLRELDGLGVEIELPKLPETVEFSQDVFSYYEERIAKGDMSAMEAFVEAVARTVRKAATHGIPFEADTLVRASTLIDRIAEYWLQPDFPINRLRLQKNSQELHVASLLSRHTLWIVRQLHLHKLMHPYLAEILEDEEIFHRLDRSVISQPQLTQIDFMLVEELKKRFGEKIYNHPRPRHWLSLWRNRKKKAERAFTAGKKDGIIAL